MTEAPLIVHGLRVRVVDIPLERPSRTGGGAMASFPFLLVDVLTAEGVTGCAYVFCYSLTLAKPLAALVDGLAPLLRGARLVPQALRQTLHRQFRLAGLQGLTGMAVAAVDIAAWDALAKACRLPLVRLLGGEPRPIPAYASFFMSGVAGAAGDAERAVAAGFRAVKVKIGYPDVADDIAVVRETRRVLGPTGRIMVDYNQSLDVGEAMARLRRLDEEDVAWAEEPTVASDLAGHARIAAAAATPVQLGENWWGLPDMAASIAAGASDLGMVNVVRIGGVSGWLQAAALAEAARLPLSSHTYQSVASHLLAVTPTAHWLESGGKANPILQSPPAVIDGCIAAGETPGCGLQWDEAAVTRFAVS